MGKHEKNTGNFLLHEDLSSIISFLLIFVIGEDHLGHQSINRSCAAPKITSVRRNLPHKIEGRSILMQR